MTRKGQNIELFTGDDLDLRVTVYSALAPSTTVKNLSGATATYAVKDKPGGADLFTPKTSTPAVGIVLAGGGDATGILTISISNTDTDALPGEKDYYHELEITIGGKIATAFTGRLRLRKSVAGTT